MSSWNCNQMKKNKSVLFGILSYQRRKRGYELLTIMKRGPIYGAEWHYVRDLLDAD